MCIIMSCCVVLAVARDQQRWYQYCRCLRKSWVDCLNAGLHSVFLSVPLHVCVSVHLFLCLFVCLSLCLSVCPYICLSVCLTVCVCSCCMPILSHLYRRWRIWRFLPTWQFDNADYLPAAALNDLLRFKTGGKWVIGLQCIATWSYHVSAELKQSWSKVCQVSFSSLFVGR